MRVTLRSSAFFLTLGLAGCKSAPPAAPATIVDMNNQPDPAAANLAPVDPNAPAAPQTASVSSAPARVLGQRSQYPQSAPTGEQYPYPNESTYAPANDDAYDQYDSQVNAGQDALYADQAPPPLPQYDQPQLTLANDQWTPGYWNYNTSGYYFVPGAWVAPPYSGALWTPGYWGYEGRRYRFHRGFWGRHIGFYGGVNYGFGYFGRGYEGGYWNNNNFFYNQRVNRVNTVDIRNVYVRNVTVVNNEHYSYNGPGGYQSRPVAAELAVYREQRLPPQQAQIQVREQAAGNRQQFFAENHGRPAVFAAPQHFNADQQPARPIQPVQRGGFGQPNNPQAQQQQVRAQQLQQNEQRTQANEQRTQANEQRAQANEQRTAQRQQQNVQQQQHTEQAQQQEQQRQQQLQQRNVQQQQRAQQLQQRSQQPGVQTSQQQQRVQSAQQHNAAAQQQNQQRQQQVQARQQQTQQNAAAEQQRAQQQGQRSQQEQVRAQQEQGRSQQQEQRSQQQQERAPQPRPQQEQRPQQQPQQARPQPAPRPAPAPRAQPAPATHTEAPHQGGEHPRH